MNEFILKLFLPIIIKILEDLLSVENLKTYGDKIFDFLEDAIASSENTVDDNLLPIIKMLRTTLNIPDND